MEEMGEEMGEEAGSPLCAHAVCVINESEICLESRRDFDAVAGHFSNEAALFQRGGTFPTRRHFSKEAALFKTAERGQADKRGPRRDEEEDEGEESRVWNRSVGAMSHKARHRLYQGTQPPLRLHGFASVCP